MHGLVCCICGKPIADEASVTMDHVVSARDGGLFRADNLRPAHGQCNKAKGWADVRRRSETLAPSNGEGTNGNASTEKGNGQ